MAVEASQPPGLAAARTGFEAARSVAVPGPRPDAEALRASYLELLKAALCDLLGTATLGAGAGPDGAVASRELRGEQLKLRSAGMDWPMYALTMVGLQRLDDLQRCVESVVREGVEGDLIEAGCWRGGASILMRATLDSLGADDRVLWVADSFQGFPAPDGPVDDEFAAFDFLAVGLEEVRANFARLGCEAGTRFVPGFFSETLPPLTGRRWALARLDGDTYEATWVSLRSLYPGVSAGGYVIVDDYGAFDECREAVDDFRRVHGISEPLEVIDWTAVRWRRESDAPIEALDAPRPLAAVSPRAVERAEPRAVPSVEELNLRRWIAELERRLTAAEADAERLRDSPFAGLAAWWRRRREGRRR